MAGGRKVSLGGQCPLKSAYGNNNIEGKTEVIMYSYIFMHMMLQYIVSLA